ncbi:hypothetical protein LshimejAT787_0310280 [Lyophyllum shimeji]|uniref:Uncharacterized protein n=1 Tax=Lyophyllum shimeji TaxID=47721 RepID=A0A9P3PJ63_LYOSH|nr:hypothetical protein LshimejAT787_0310280 [Lyophyllum shimeji]
MHVHHEHPSIKAIANYALQKSSADPPSTRRSKHSSLQNQHHWAVDDNEPYTFSHYLFISRTYRLTPEEESALLNSAPQTKAPSSKKSEKNERCDTAGANDLAGRDLSIPP